MAMNQIGNLLLSEDKCAWHKMGWALKASTQLQSNVGPTNPVAPVRCKKVMTLSCLALLLSAVSWLDVRNPPKNKCAWICLSLICCSFVHPLLTTGDERESYSTGC